MREEVPSWPPEWTKSLNGREREEERGMEATRATSFLQKVLALPLMASTEFNVPRKFEVHTTIQSGPK